MESGKRAKTRNFDVDTLSADTTLFADWAADGESLLSYVKSLTKLRNDYPVLMSGEATCSAENGILKITATKAGEKTLTTYHNFSAEPKQVRQSGDAVFGSTAVPRYGTAVFAL